MDSDESSEYLKAGEFVSAQTVQQVTKVSTEGTVVDELDRSLYPQADAMVPDKP